MESGDAVIDGDGVVIDLAELDANHSLEFLNHAFRLERRAESNQLQIAAHWADLHSGDALAQNTSALPGRERARLFGGDGTPAVGEFCVGEFAAVAELSTRTGNKLIADALDLRHRYPQTWARIRRYEVPVWVCRQIVGKTRHLTLEAARYVDAAVAPYLSSLPPGRLLDLVEAKMIEADPADAEARARLAQANRFVRTGRTTDCGIKTLIARAEAGDVIMFTALCDRIAQILGLNGDGDSLDVRRSKAIGIIANPLRACTLLAEYEGRDLTQPPEPDPNLQPVPRPFLSPWRVDDQEPLPDPDPTDSDRPVDLDATDTLAEARIVDTGVADRPVDLDHADTLADTRIADTTVTDPGVTDPGVARAGGAGAGVDGPEVVSPGAVGYELAGPEVDGPRADGPRADSPRADGPRADGRRVAGPGAVDPELADPGAVGGGAVGPELAGPEVHGPGAGGPALSGDPETPDAPGLLGDAEAPSETAEFDDHEPSTKPHTATTAEPAANPTDTDEAGPVPKPAEDPVITETDLHPAEIDPYRPVNYAAELQAILDQYRISPRDLLPKTVIYLHLDRNTLVNGSGVVRAEDVGPITANQFKHWIRGKHLTITPVIDPANTPAVDAYETTDRLKDALRMITPAEAFPYGTNTGRRTDHDHAIPYRPPPDGPPGQTSTARILRLSRTPHRLKTHAGWQVRTPEPGTTIWRTPHGWYFLHNPAGTLPLGNGAYARTIWDTMINDFTATRYPDQEDTDDEQLTG